MAAKITAENTDDRKPFEAMIETNGKKQTGRQDVRWQRLHLKSALWELVGRAAGI